jgi:hypothetical protein
MLSCVSQEELEEKRNMAIASGMPGVAPPQSSGNGPLRAGGMYEADGGSKQQPLVKGGQHHLWSCVHQLSALVSVQTPVPANTVMTAP